jgi:hypothetical protein
MGIRSLLYLYSVTNIPSMPCARKASKQAMWRIFASKGLDAQQTAFAIKK